MGRNVVCIAHRNICTDAVWKPEGGKLIEGSRLVQLINMKSDLEVMVCEDTDCIDL